MRYWLAVALSVYLSGCQSVEDGDRCKEYGFERGTTAFAVCKQRIDMMRERRMDRSIDAPNYDY
ncbi:MAG: hypothetical protein BGP09_29210 [Rhizobium sp. 60-20]|jgi:hypothetical protein|nr:MAG: hypothetical protein BGP09_29210 [Rhizobium sp. 60-20]RKD69414.1 hypothetical protein BJ928_104554 [Rhizobium sp. WW_1]